jgi:hypothetical protein
MTVYRKIRGHSGIPNGIALTSPHSSPTRACCGTRPVLTCKPLGMSPFRVSPGDKDRVRKGDGAASRAASPFLYRLSNWVAFVAPEWAGWNGMRSNANQDPGASKRAPASFGNHLAWRGWQSWQSHSKCFPFNDLVVGQAGQKVGNMANSPWQGRGTFSGRVVCYVFAPAPLWARTIRAGVGRVALGIAPPDDPAQDHQDHYLRRAEAYSSRLTVSANSSSAQPSRS